MTDVVGTGTSHNLFENKERMTDDSSNAKNIFH